MATRRYSITPQGNDHTVVDAVGAAVVTAPIELTVDVDALRAQGASSNAALGLVIEAALEQIASYIQGAGKFNLPG